MLKVALPLDEDKIDIKIKSQEKNIKNEKDSNKTKQAETDINSLKERKKEIMHEEIDLDIKILKKNNNGDKEDEKLLQEWKFKKEKNISDSEIRKDWSEKTMNENIKKLEKQIKGIDTEIEETKKKIEDIENKEISRNKTNNSLEKGKSKLEEEVEKLKKQKKRKEIRKAREKIGNMVNNWWIQDDSNLQMVKTLALLSKNKHTLSAVLKKLPTGLHRIVSRVRVATSH